MNKINFKQPKYVLPLILFPFICMGGYFINGFSSGMSKEKKPAATQRSDFSTDLGGNKNIEIKSKQDAYEDFYNGREDNRSMIGGLERENELLNQYEDNLSIAEKRKIDSLNLVKERERLSDVSRGIKFQQKYYQENTYKNQQENKRRDDEQYERSMKMLEMINGSSNKNSARKAAEKEEPQEDNEAKEWKDQQLSLMREQMMLMDSIEKSKDPDIKARLEAQERLSKNEQDLDLFLNSSLSVSKAPKSASFNSVYKTKESTFIKAVIDENINGYLGSRIRIRLLEDIYVGNLKIKQGTLLYALISGFTLQRVNLNIVSVMYQNEILPVNLSLYDVDGMEGLYVPSSAFREMARTMGQNVVQGQNLNMSGNFFSNTVSSLFQSTSRTIAELIRKNKVNLKYNSYVYLIDNKELQKKKQNIYKTN